MSSAEQNPSTHEQAYQSVREKVATYIQPEYVDDVMHRQLPRFDNMTLSEAIAEDPELAHHIVEAMFDWRDAHGRS